jgi:hypothetical protein
MKIINLKRVLGSLTLVFTVASCSGQADLVSLDGFADAPKHLSDRPGETHKPHCQLSLIKIADNILVCSRADCIVKSSTTPIPILSNCEQTVSDRKIMPGLLTLPRIHFPDSSTFSFFTNHNANQTYRLADVALPVIPPDHNHY